MSTLFLRLMLVVGIGMTGAACQDNSYAAPRGYNQPAPGYSNPYYNSGYAPAPSHYGYSQPAPNYNQPRYTTVTVTNRGQNGYRDDVVQQQVVCGSQYYDGYRTRTAPRC
jgi:hypothetical protein